MKMKINKLLAMTLLGVTAACLSTSCTYDYFVDETNYRVYVPGVANGTISDCFVAVYDEKGQLMRSRRTGLPESDPRVAMGIFSFQLPPGKYTAYCYANGEEIQIAGEKSEEHAFIAMKPLASPANAYAQPSEVNYQILETEIKPDYKLKTDTAVLVRYVGRITVHFKNLPLSLGQVARVQAEALGVATRQFFPRDTLTTRFTASDYMFDDFEFIPFASPDEWAVTRRYFPSIPGQAMRVQFHFIDAAGRVITTIPVDIIDTKTGTPLTLHRGEHLIVEVDRYLVVGISLVGWDETIKDSGRDI
jgi:hypothetical protein